MQVATTIREAIVRALVGLGVETDAFAIVLEYPADLAHGDYATNAALMFSKQLGKNPRELAQEIATALGEVPGVASIEVAGPGFINFTLSPQEIGGVIAQTKKKKDWGTGDARMTDTILVEYTDPNPFKAFHIGHLMSNAIGESIARLLEASGAKVIRANYQGDLGVHVASALWGIHKLGINPQTAEEFGAAYAAGAAAYKEDETAKQEIDAINKKLYERSDETLNALYNAGRTASLEVFEKIYATLGTSFDHYFFESETAPIGKAIVESNPQIFVESDGARVFKGEEYGLHTRVFLNAAGLPTYEAKELGLAKLKKELYPETTQLIVVTANEVSEYFRVLKQAIHLIYPEIAEELLHIAHGMMKLPEGKMSSRTGKVITGESLLADLEESARARAAESRADDAALLSQQIAVGAIKFQILRQDTKKDIIFERERALSFEGDSGPYLQYTHARARAILEKAGEQGVVPQVDFTMPPSEVSRLLHRFPEIVARASHELAPHHVAQYLLSLAGAFNSWYSNEILLDGTPAAAHKVALADAVRATLAKGLWLLGIPAPEKM
jgi:arginyl-tRNA synthetase